MPVAFEGSSTPIAKKLSRLQQSRDKWKVKYAQLKLRIRVVEEQARWLQANRDQWKAKAEALQAQLLAQNTEPGPDQGKNTEPGPDQGKTPRQNLWQLKASGRVTSSALIASD